MTNGNLFMALILCLSDGDSEPPDPRGPHRTRHPGAEADTTERRCGSHLVHQTQPGQHSHSHDDMSEVSIIMRKVKG